MKSRTNGLDWDELLPRIGELLSSGKTYSEIATELNISFSSAKKGAELLGLDYKTNSRWTEEEINELRALLLEHKNYFELEKIFLGRHPLQSIKGIIRYRGDSLNLKYSGNTRHYLSEEEIDEAVNLVKTGLGYEEIARKLSSDPHAVKRALLKKGERTFTREELVKLGYVDGLGFTGLTEEVLRDLIEKKNLSYKAIAKKYGINSSTVSRRAEILNIERPEKAIEEKVYAETYIHRLKLLEKFLGHEPSEEEKKLRLIDIIPQELVKEVYERNNFSCPDSANELGISLSAFSNLKKELGLTRPHSPLIKDYPEEFYRKLYVEDGLSYGDIAEIVGLSTDTVRKYLCKVFPEAKKTGRYLSMGEKMVGQVLEELNIPFTYNKRLSSQNPEDPDKIYIIDFVFKYKNKQVWIEYNGAQHYKFIEYFYRTRDRYEAQLERDRFVEELATKLGVNLLIIPYTKDTSSLVKESIVNYLNTIT